MSWERVLREGGRVARSDCEARLMEVTLLVLSQFTPFHLQKSVEGSHPDGGVSKDCRKSFMVDLSSAEVRERRRRKMNRGFFPFPIPIVSGLLG